MYYQNDLSPIYHVSPIHRDMAVQADCECQRLSFGDRFGNT